MNNTKPKLPETTLSSLEKRLKQVVTKSLITQGVLPESRLAPKSKQILAESYVANAKTYDLKTEFLSSRAKNALYGIYESHVKALNEISTKLDSANKDYKEITSKSSVYRSLKQDEMYNLNAVKLHELFFANISDLASEITMDSMAFLRLQRDWGDFDAWQRDFVACALSARDGWVVMGFDSYIGKYINFFIDGHDNHVSVGCLPVLVVDVHHHAYYKDYMEDKLSYIFAMMKEIRWPAVEARISIIERSGISAVLGTSPPGAIPAQPVVAPTVNNEIGTV